MYATRTNSSKASLPSLEFAVPPMDHARQKTKHESMCFSMSLSRLMLAMRPLGSASCSTRSDLNVRMRFTATLVPSYVVSATSLISRFMNRIDTGTSQSNKASTRSLNDCLMVSGKVLSHERHNGRQPS